jgi:hypothetical protein
VKTGYERRVSGLAALILAVGLAGALTSCGGTSRTASTSTISELALRRADFVLVSRLLEGARASVKLEVNASRHPWSQIAHGLPSTISASLRRQVSVASFRASHIQAPAYMIFAPGPTAGRAQGRFTGPAAGVAGLFQAYASLSQRGWKILQTTVDGIANGQPRDARFLRGNADLYLTCIYDGHFDLALIGRSLLDSYNKLGGSKLFGSSLTEARIASLERFYAKDLGLEPHSVYRLSR